MWLLSQSYIFDACESIFSANPISIKLFNFLVSYICCIVHRIDFLEYSIARLLRNSSF
jgi:hypothetical protein